MPTSKVRSDHAAHASSATVAVPSEVTACTETAPALPPSRWTVMTAFDPFLIALKFGDANPSSVSLSTIVSVALVRPTRRMAKFQIEAPSSVAMKKGR